MDSKTNRPKLKLINNNGTLGYTLKNIKEVLDENTYIRFGEWMFGQTVGVYKGDHLVYKYDFDLFLGGRPPFD